jgi:FtsZ-binding cell division protein ZapB
LKDHLWDPAEEVFEDQIERGLMLDEEIHFLKEENDRIEEDQTAQAQTEDLQIFTNDISVEDPVTFKHLRRAFSIYVE